MEINKGLIIIAEDDPVIGNLLNTVITSQGYETILCKDGAEAAEAIRTHPEAIGLWTDYKMPQKDGMELIRELKDLHPAPLKVVFATTYADTPDVLAQLEQMGDFIKVVKPYRPAQIIRALGYMGKDVTIPAGGVVISVEEMKHGPRKQPLSHSGIKEKVSSRKPEQAAPRDPNSPDSPEWVR